MYYLYIYADICVYMNILYALTFCGNIHLNDFNKNWC